MTRLTKQDNGESSAFLIIGIAFVISCALIFAAFIGTVTEIKKQEAKDNISIIKADYGVSMSMNDYLAATAGEPIIVQHEGKEIAVTIVTKGDNLRLVSNGDVLPIKK